MAGSGRKQVFSSMNFSRCVYMVHYTAFLSSDSSLKSLPIDAKSERFTDIKLHLSYQHRLCFRFWSLSQIKADKGDTTAHTHIRYTRELQATYNQLVILKRERWPFFFMKSHITKQFWQTKSFPYNNEYTGKIRSHHLEPIQTLNQFNAISLENQKYVDGEVSLHMWKLFKCSSSKMVVSINSTFFWLVLENLMSIIGIKKNLRCLFSLRNWYFIIQHV